jgi:hypothetical protein
MFALSCHSPSSLPHRCNGFLRTFRRLPQHCSIPADQSRAAQAGRFARAPYHSTIKTAASSGIMAQELASNPQSTDADSKHNEIFFDAHCHLQDPRLEGRVQELLTLASSVGVKWCAVNGTNQVRLAMCWCSGSCALVFSTKNRSTFLCVSEDHRWALVQHEAFPFPVPPSPAISCHT